jgi:hypothetical protein
MGWAVIAIFQLFSLYIRVASDLHIRCFELCVPALCSILLQPALPRLRCLNKARTAVATERG